MKPFKSPLGPKMRSFLEVQRATGRKYQSAEGELRRIDRFVASQRNPRAKITPALAHAWLSAKPHVGPSTQRSRASVFRLFCEYLRRFDPDAFVPDRLLLPTRVPERKPHIFSTADVKSVLDRALGLNQRGWWFRRQSVHALLATLYGTGLRVGEACRLKVSDVDLEERVLVVRDTKFFKTRYVPFSKSLAKVLSAFWDVRKTLAPSDGDSPFFINRLRRQVSPRKFSWLFHSQFVRPLRLGKGGPRVGPRLHDLRRTFAVHRLVHWYREGADLWAKLPLLATYMGHSNVLATHVYLTATAELLEAASGRFERTYGSLLSAEQVRS